MIAQAQVSTSCLDNMKPLAGTFSLLALASCVGAFPGSPTHQQPVIFGPDNANDGFIPSNKPSISNNAFDEYIEDVMERWHAPGMAVAIINGSETWAKGFGYATLNPSTPVTAHTLFYTGSTTKSFTAAGLSLLIDNSSDYSDIQWETPISQVLREDFVLSDEWATAHITIEDALCHRTGYPRHDLSIGNDTQELVRSFRHLPLSAEPRTKFQYNNMMFATAGYLISKLTGLSRSEFFHKYLWTPMGMNETFLGTWDPAFSSRSANLALAEGYWWVNNTDTTSTGSYVLQPDPGSLVLADDAAGAVLSNVLDYEKYLRVMMTESGPISRAGHRELKRPRTFHDMHAPFFAPGPVTYALGWMGGVFEGEMVYFHTGTVSTFVTFMVMVPAREYGIVVLANSNSRVRELVTYRALYDLFGVDESRRTDFEMRFREEEELARKEIATCAERLYPDVPSPPIPASVLLANHTGQYSHPAYDSIFVSLDCEGGASGPSPSSAANSQECQLVLARGPESQEQLGGNLEHKTGDFWLTYLFFPEIPDVVQGCSRTQFRVDSSGSVTHIGIDLRMEEDNAPLVWFEKSGQ